MELRQTRILKQSFNFLNASTQELGADIRIAHRKLKEASRKYEASEIEIFDYLFYLKTTVRAFFGLVDVQTFSMRRAVERSAREWSFRISNRTLAKLIERRYDSKNDSVTGDTQRIGTSDRVKLAFKYFPELFEAKYVFEAGDENYRGFKVLVRERNYFTHPEKLEHLFPTESLIAAEPTLLWYCAEVTRLMDACGTRLGEETSKDALEFEGFRDAQLAATPSASTIFDQDFYDKVTQHDVLSIKYIHEVLRRMGQDTRKALALVSAAEPEEMQFARRTLARTFFSEVEGTIGFVCFFLSAAVERGDLMLTALEEQMLKPCEFTPERLVDACNLFSREFGNGHEVSTRAASWNQFLVSHRVRDQATHPRKLGDLRMRDRAFQSLMGGLGWFNQEIIGGSLRLAN